MVKHRVSVLSLGLLLSCTILFASPKPLSKSEIIQLSSKAALGSSRFLKSLVRERRRLLDLQEGPAGLTISEEQSLANLTLVLAVLSPKDASPKVRAPKRLETAPPVLTSTASAGKIESPPKNPAQAIPQFYIRDSVERISSVMIGGDYSRFLKSQGYDGVDIKINPQPDLKGKLPDFSALEDVPKVSMNLSGFEKLSEAQVRKFSLSLPEGPNMKETASALLPEELQSFLYWRSFLGGGNLSLSVGSGTFDKTADFFYRRRSNPGKFFNRVLIEENVPGAALSLEDVITETAWTDFLRAMARGSGFETLAGFRDAFGDSPEHFHNLALYRAIQNSPGGFVIIPVTEKSPLFDADRFSCDRDVRKDIAEAFTKIPFGQKSVKTANLVVCVQKKYLSKRDAVRWSAPALNALQASGFEVKISFDRILFGSQLYYFLAQDGGVSAATHKGLLRLMEFAKSGEGPPVILHPLSEIRNSGPWKEIRHFFGIPSSEKGWLKNPPQTAMAFGKNALWGDRGRGDDFKMTLIRPRRVNEEGGSTVLSAVADSETVSLILRSGNCFLVNGNYLDFEAACFLSQIMDGALRSPTLAYVTSTSSSTVALALSDTTIKIQTPPASDHLWKLTHFDAVGKKIKEQLVSGREAVEARLRAWELLVLIPD